MPEPPAWLVRVLPGLPRGKTYWTAPAALRGAFLAWTAGWAVATVLQAAAFLRMGSAFFAVALVIFGQGWVLLVGLVLFGPLLHGPRPRAFYIATVGALVAWTLVNALRFASGGPPFAGDVSPLDVAAQVVPAVNAASSALALALLARPGNWRYLSEPLPGANPPPRPPTW